MSARPKRDPDAHRWWIGNDAAWDALEAAKPPGFVMCACHARYFALDPIAKRGTRKGKR